MGVAQVHDADALNCCSEALAPLSQSLTGENSGETLKLGKCQEGAYDVTGHSILTQNHPGSCPF